VLHNKKTQRILNKAMKVTENDHQFYSAKAGCALLGWATFSSAIARMLMLYFWNTLLNETGEIC
jgi:hypothetical protein